MEKVREPFIQAAFVSGGLSFLLAILGYLGFRTVGRKIIRDISDNRIMYETLFNQVHDAVFLQTRYFEACNDRACRLFGKKRQHIIGRPAESFSPRLQASGAFSTDLIATHRQSVLEGRDQCFDWQFEPSPGTIIDTIVSLKAIKIGGQRKILASVRDITEQRIHEREHEVLKERLFHAQKLESIGTMAGGIAHDFNNLLTPIIGYGNLIKTDATNPSGRSKIYADEILQAAHVAKELVEQILTFSCKNQIETSPILLQEIIKNSLGLIAPLIAKNVRLTTEIDVNCSEIAGSSTQFQQVLINLVRNASDAMMQTSGNLCLVLRQTQVTPDLNQHFKKVVADC